MYVRSYKRIAILNDGLLDVYDEFMKKGIDTVHCI